MIPSFFAAVTVASQRVEGMESRDLIALAWLSSTPIAEANAELPNAAMTSEKEFILYRYPM